MPHFSILPPLVAQIFVDHLHLEGANPVKRARRYINTAATVAFSVVVTFVTITIGPRIVAAGPIEGSYQWQLQQRQQTELKTLEQEFQNRGNLPDSVQNQAYQEQLREEYARRAADIKKKYLQLDDRSQMIKEAEEKYGYRNQDGTCCQKDPRTGKIFGDIENTGSNPKDVRSDVDLNAKTHEAADNLKSSWDARGHKIEVYEHKYVDVTTDTTLWRPCQTPECWAAKVKDLDAWTTEGGLQGTNNAGRIRDPKGYYLDNEKKFIHGQEMVKHGDLAEGLKTAAKSLDKPAIYSGMKPEKAADIANPGERRFWQQAERLRNYGDPVEAGIANPGDTPAVKAEKVKAWLDDANERMRIAKRRLVSWGEALDKTRANIQQSLANSNPADPNNQKMNERRATTLKDEIERVRRSNEAAQEVNRQQGGIGTEDPNAGRRKAFSDGVKEGQKIADEVRRAAQAPGAEPNPIVKAANQLDDKLKDTLRIGETPENSAAWRRQINKLDGAMDRVGHHLDRIFMAKEIYNAGTQLSEYLDHINAAMDRSLTDRAAEEHFRAAETIARNMIADGTLGAGMGVLLGAMPTVGSVVAVGYVSYSGTRWLLENTRTGQIIDRAAGRAMDAGFNAAENVEDKWREATGRETTRMREERESESLLNTYREAIRRGRIKLRSGISMDELVDAARRFDLAALDSRITERLPRLPTSQGKDNRTKNSNASSEPFCIYVLDLSGGSVYVGHPSDTKQPACSFEGGGLCRGASNSPPRIIRTVTCKNTHEEAVASWCGTLRGRRVSAIPLTGDAKANVYDGDYWLGTAPNCSGVKVASTQPGPGQAASTQSTVNQSGADCALTNDISCIVRNPSKTKSSAPAAKSDAGSKAKTDTEAKEKAEKAAKAKADAEAKAKAEAAARAKVEAEAQAKADAAAKAKAEAEARAKAEAAAKAKADTEARVKAAQEQAQRQAALARHRKEEATAARVQREQQQRQAALARHQAEEAAAARAEQERQQREAARHREEEAAAERARVEHERAAREQAERQRAANRAAADADCRKRNGVVAEFDAATGKHQCGCPQGMVIGAGNICVLQREAATHPPEEGSVARPEQQARAGRKQPQQLQQPQQEQRQNPTQQSNPASQRELAASICAKQNAEVQSIDANNGNIVCVCRSGMVYNRAKSACITQQALREEDAGTCRTQFANSVAEYENGQLHCNCAQGWAWNRAEKACITVEARRREATQACSKDFPGSVVGNLDLATNKEECVCPGGTDWGGANNKSCVAVNVQQTPTAPQTPPVQQTPARCPPFSTYNGRCYTLCPPTLGGPPYCPYAGGSECISLPEVSGGSPICFY